MRDLLLIVAVAGILVFGWFMVGKLGGFLERIRQEQAEPRRGNEKVLRIGFSDPLTADSLSGALEKYSNVHPNVSAYLVSGTQTEVLKEFFSRKLDLIFLPENALVPEKLRGRVEEVSLEHFPVIMQYGGLQIDPITQGPVPQKIVWAQSERTSEIGQFIQYLKGGNPLPDRKL